MNLIEPGTGSGADVPAVRRSLNRYFVGTQHVSRGGMTFGPRKKTGT